MEKDELERDKDDGRRLERGLTERINIPLS